MSRPVETGADAEHLGHLGLSLTALRGGLAEGASPTKAIVALNLTELFTKLLSPSLCLKTHNTSTRKENSLLIFNGTPKLNTPKSVSGQG
jgi:hypothetical protein